MFDDLDAATLSLRERRIGFVFQHYALFRHMTVLDNVAFGLRARPRRTRPVRHRRFERRSLELLDLVQLADFGNRYPAQLSGGQRQRVALARALAIGPRVLLLDEPFGALDAKVRKELRRWLREFHDQTGHTTLFVTHDQEEAFELADRVAILNQGRVEQVGAPRTIQTEPASAFVAAFVEGTAPALKPVRAPKIAQNQLSYRRGHAVSDGLTSPKNNPKFCIVLVKHAGHLWHWYCDKSALSRQTPFSPVGP